MVLEIAARERTGPDRAAPRNDAARIAEAVPRSVGRAGANGTVGSRGTDVERGERLTPFAMPDRESRPASTRTRAALETRDGRLRIVRLDVSGPTRGQSARKG